MNTQKVLIVDDDFYIKNVLSTILESAEFEVITASNKNEGVQKAKAEKPDLAILDVIMTTHYEGFEMAEEMVNDPELKNIPFLMHTSIDVLTTNKDSVREMAREFRKDPQYKELQVILVKDIVSGNAGIDYRTEDGQTVWIPVGGFLKKPVDPEKLIKEVKSLIGK